jgi:hypothetical protein
LKRKTQNDDTPGYTGTLAGSRTGHTALRREQRSTWREVTAEKTEQLAGR